MNPRERGVKLLDAIVEDKQAEALRLVKQGADFTLVRKGDNAIHLAARKGWLNIVQSMSSKGADLAQRNVHGNTAAHYAAKGGYLDLVRYLKDSKVDLNAFNDDGQSPLHDAVIHQPMDVIEALVDLGMNPNIQNKVTGETPIHTAAIYGRQPALEGLLIKNASSHIKNFKHKKPEDVAKSPTFRVIIRMYDALKTAIRTGYIQAQGMKLDTQSVSKPVIVERVGVVIECIDIPKTFPTTFYCRREKTENSTVPLKQFDEEHMFSDVFHIQISDVQRNCDVKLLIPLYKAPTEKEQMMLRFINHEDTDKMISEYITKEKKHFCIVETTLVPETTCVCFITVRPKREDTDVSSEDTVIKSEMEIGFSLAIPAKAFAEKTVLSLKVYDTKNEEENNPEEANTDEKETQRSDNSDVSPHDKPTTSTDTNAANALTATMQNTLKDGGLITDAFQVTVSGEQPKKGLTMQIPMFKDCSGMNDVVIIRADERTLHDDTPLEVLPLKPNIVNCNLVFEVSHFSIYVAAPKDRTASTEDLMSIKSRLSSAKDRRKPATFFVMIKQIEGYKNTLLVDCGLANTSQRRFDKWTKEEYEIQEPRESEYIMLTPGDNFYISIKGNASFEDVRDSQERKLTFSTCRASFQAFNIKLERHVRTEKESCADVIVSKKVDNGLKEVGRLRFKMNMPPPPPKWMIADPKTFQPVPAAKSPYGALKSIFGKTNTTKKK